MLAAEGGQLGLREVRVCSSTWLTSGPSSAGKAAISERSISTCRGVGTSEEQARYTGYNLATG